MEIALTTSSKPPALFRSRTFNILRRRQSAIKGRGSSYSHSFHHRLSVSCSFKLPASESFGESHNAAAYVNELSASLSKSVPKQLKDFPWKKAEDVIVQRLLTLSKEVLKWSFPVFFMVNLVADVLLSITRNRELLIPIGMFVGVHMAEFLKETSLELFQSKKKEWTIDMQLIGIGFLFVSLKFLVWYSAIPGKMFISHVSNGGLMQVLWFAKK